MLLAPGAPPTVSGQLCGRVCLHCLVTSLWGVPELCWDRRRPEDALCPGGAGDLGGCSVFACIAVPPLGEAQVAAERTSSASARTTWQTGDAGDAVGLLVVGWGSEPEPAASNECAADFAE